MPVFDARGVSAWEAGAFLYVSLAEVFGDVKLAESSSDPH